MPVNLNYINFLPVKFGTDFNVADECNLGFSRTYCQPVERTDETPFPVDVTQAGFATIPITASWTLGANWAALDNVITHTVGSTATAALNGFLTNGNVTKILIVISANTAGSFTVNDGVTVASPSYSINQDEVYIFDAGSANLIFTPTSTFDGVITVTGVEDIDFFNYGTTNKIINGTFATDTDWEKGTGWTIAAVIAAMMLFGG